MRPTLYFGRRQRWLRNTTGIISAMMLVLAFGSSAFAQKPQPHNKPGLDTRARSPFNLQASATLRLNANLVACDILNDGRVCADPSGSGTTPGGFWPAGTANAYIFNSGLQLAGINGADAGPWANDTVGAYFFDARGSQEQGDNLTQIFNSLDPADLAAWPADAFITDTSIFHPLLIGQRAVSDQDSWVSYWEGDPERNPEREHAMGIRVDQRSLSFNAPAGAENTIFFIYKFTNVTNDPAFQQAQEAKFNIQLPDGGWTITNVYAAFAMDPDVTGDAGNNFSSALLPFNMGYAYHQNFTGPDFDFAARADLYNPPFFQGPGFIGVKYLQSPINPTTGQPVGLTLFTNTTNPSSANSLFPDPLGVSQLFRYLKGDVNPALGDPPCPIPNPMTRRLCYVGQAPTDTRMTQVSGPLTLGPGQSQSIVVAYTFGAPVRADGYTPGATLAPGTPSRAPGFNNTQVLLIEKVAGLIQIPASALRVIGTDTSVVEDSLRPGRDFVPRSLVANALIAQQIYNVGFLLPRPPEAPRFTLVPGDEQVTVIWEPSRTETAGDPYFAVASNPANGALFDPNYRQFDLEGYRIYRATGLSGNFELIAQFDKAGTSFTDVTGQFDPNFVETEGQPADTTEIPLTGVIVQFPEGTRVRAASGAVIVTAADTARLRGEILNLQDTGTPFIFQDTTVRNGITYRYIVTAFDINSLKSVGPGQSLESPRQEQQVTPRKSGQDVTAADAEITIVGESGNVLNPDAAIPAIDAQGRFAGPQPPTNGIRPAGLSLALGEALSPGNITVVRIDSVVPFTYNAVYYLSLGDGSKAQATCPDEIGNIRHASECGRDGASIFAGNVTLPADTSVISGRFANTPLFSGQAQFTVHVGHPQQASGVADFTPHSPQFWDPAPPATAADGGSRWFSGANETMADPTLGLQWGTLPGITRIFSPQPFGDADVSTTGRRWYQAMFTIMRAADVQITWNASGVASVRDVTHDVAVPFKARPQAGYGFLPDADGNGTINFNDTRRLEFQDAFGGWKTAGANVPLAPQPVVGQVDVTGDNVADGSGFALIINGETYFFEGAVPTSGTWTLRSYAGLVQRSGSGYTFTPDDVRMPAIPGLVVALTVNQAAQVASRADITQVHTVPDPYYVRSAFDVGPSNKTLRFVNLPDEATIRIYSLNGTLVQVLEHDDPLGGGELAWDLRNRNNQFVASGVYFFVVESPTGGKHTGKFTVVQFTR